MGIAVTLDRMSHARAVHQELGKEIALEGCRAFGGKGEELNPLDLVAMSVASCMMIVMAKGAGGRAIDLTGTWADAAYDFKDRKIASITVTIHSPYSPTQADREFLEKESHRCPVYLAVKDAVAVKAAFEWGTAATPAAKKAGRSSCPCG
jgi:putative redox protein